MLVDIFLLIISSGVPATRLNAQFNYVSILSYVMCSMYVSILSYVMCSMYVSILSYVMCSMYVSMLCPLFHAVYVWENCYFRDSSSGM